MDGETMRALAAAGVIIICGITAGVIAASGPALSGATLVAIGLILVGAAVAASIMSGGGQGA